MADARNPACQLLPYFLILSPDPALQPLHAAPQGIFQSKLFFVQTFFFFSASRLVIYKRSIEVFIFFFVCFLMFSFK
tara:strand:+ start:336 stop:566 length:231 start_codon:yes stop_codon:yes gene_type:complete